MFFPHFCPQGRAGPADVPRVQLRDPGFPQPLPHLRALLPVPLQHLLLPRLRQPHDQVRGAGGKTGVWGKNGGKNGEKMAKNGRETVKIRQKMGERWRKFPSSGGKIRRFLLLLCLHQPHDQVRNAGGKKGIWGKKAGKKKVKN